MKRIKALVDAFCLKIPITCEVVLEIYFCKAKIILVLARYYYLIAGNLFSYPGHKRVSFVEVMKRWQTGDFAIGRNALIHQEQGPFFKLVIQKV